MRNVNPFKPSLGATPPVLVGRQAVLDDYAYALDSGSGAPELICLITGQRGVGKTVLLNALEYQASLAGWEVFSDNANEGFTSRLTGAVIARINQKRPPKTRVTSVSAGGFGVGMSKDPQLHGDITLRQALTNLFEIKNEIDRTAGQEPTGILITLDELHHIASSKEIVEFASTIQLLVREGLNISAVMAGIPSAVEPLLADKNNDNPVTFLRRANRVELGSVSDNDVRKALQEPLSADGWDMDALELATLACKGYPFMIQLVGYWSLRASGGSKITLADARQGVSKALRLLGRLVHAPALEDLSGVDRTFLVHMSVDDGPSKTSDLASRMGVDMNYISVYRQRLIDALMIQSTRVGFVDFTLPGMREYLREHWTSGFAGAPA